MVLLFEFVFQIILHFPPFGLPGGNDPQYPRSHGVHHRYDEFNHLTNREVPLFVPAIGIPGTKWFGKIIAPPVMFSTTRKT
jgi:hypothetical protein